MLIFLDLIGGVPWTSHRAGNPECSLDFRERGREGEFGGREEVKKIIKNNKNKKVACNTLPVYIGNIISLWNL